MKRVLLVSEARTFGGAEVYLERLAEGIPGWSACLAVPRREALSSWADRLAARGVPVIRYDETVIGWSRLGSKDVPAPDLVHVNLPSTYDGRCGLLPWRLRALWGVPVTTSEHLTGLARSRRRLWLKRRTASRVAGVLVAQEANRKDLLAQGLPASRIQVIPHGVPDPGPPRALPPRDRLRLAVLATLEPRKRIDVLLRALARADGVPAELEVGGTGPEEARLRELARELGVADRVRFHGRITDASAFLAAAHCVVLASRLEGMPLVLLDAMAAGRGTLTTALPGLETVSGGDVGLHVGETPESWADALGFVWSHPEQVAAWGRAARERFERSHTLERSRERVGAFWNQIQGAA